MFLLFICVFLHRLVSLLASLLTFDIDVHFIEFFIVSRLTFIHLSFASYFLKMFSLLNVLIYVCFILFSTYLISFFLYLFSILFISCIYSHFCFLRSSPSLFFSLLLRLSLFLCFLSFYVLFLFSPSFFSFSKSSRTYFAFFLFIHLVLFYRIFAFQS